MTIKQMRPKFINLFKIHLPVTGVTSIAHRIAGAILFLSTPLFIYLFGLSLKDSTNYLFVFTLIGSIGGKVVLTVVIWALGHHLLAGIRFLLIDIDIGIDMTVARRTAWIVNIAGIVVFIVSVFTIWL